jgi:outer membrane lipoprotein-sorting protein
MKRLALFISLLLLAGSSPASEPEGAPGGLGDPVPHSAETEPSSLKEEALLDEILRQMDVAYQGVQSYRAEFNQESETKAFQRKRKASGKVYFLKPAEMRWTYLQPEEREVYLSGEQIHMYLPSRNQVIEQTLNDAMPGMAPARLFMGVEELVGSFVVSLAHDNENEEAFCLRLTPKEKGAISVEEILLWLGKTDFLPLRTESRDVLGNRTTLVFHNREVNIPLKREIFRFQMPPGAEVLRSPF